MAQTKPSDRAARGTGDSVFDYDGTMQRLGGDRELYDELVQVFLEDSADLMHRLQNAIERNDGRAIEHAAHTLKGLTLNFGAPQAVSAAATIEEQARAGNHHDVVRMLPQLQDAVGKLTRALQPSTAT
jgi:HPt (histidine-containing phosphotransfer) domain-containing protein